MMTGWLQQWEQEKHCFSPAFDRAMTAVLSRELDAWEAGKHVVDGEDIFFLVQETVTGEAGLKRPEMHTAYCDIHIPLSGTELQKYHCRFPAGQALEDRLETEDIAFYPYTEGFQDLMLGPGQYAVYLPGELHSPCCALGKAGNIRKIVVKIRAACLR